MEWFTSLLPSLAGLPWYAVAAIVILSITATKGVDGLLKLWRFGFEREKYQDDQENKEHDALVNELKKRIEELAKEIGEVKREAREDRLSSSRLLADEKAAHAKCQIDMAELRGEVRVMQEKIKRLEKHDAANEKHVEDLKAKLEEVPKS